MWPFCFVCASFFLWIGSFFGSYSLICLHVEAMIVGMCNRGQSDMLQVIVRTLKQYTGGVFYLWTEPWAFDAYRVKFKFKLLLMPSLNSSKVFVSVLCGTSKQVDPFLAHAHDGWMCFFEILAHELGFGVTSAPWIGFLLSLAMPCKDGGVKVGDNLQLLFPILGVNFGVTISFLGEFGGEGVFVGVTIVGY